MHFQRFSLVKFPALLGMNIHKMKGGDNKVSLIKKAVTLVHALKNLKCPKIWCSYVKERHLQIWQL